WFFHSRPLESGAFPALRENAPADPSLALLHGLQLASYGLPCVGLCLRSRTAKRGLWQGEFDHLAVDPRQLAVLANDRGEHVAKGHASAALSAMPLFGDLTL